MLNSVELENYQQNSESKVYDATKYDHFESIEECYKKLLFMTRSCKKSCFSYIHDGEKFFI